MRISRATLSTTLLYASFLAIYLPQAGHGFIQDDFRWILESRLQSGDDAFRLVFADVGFYRPLVSLSFAIDHWLWGLSPLGYAATNLAFCLLGSALLCALARSFGLPPAASVVVLGVWLLNFHGVNMAVLWISGRTALLVSVFSLLCAHAVIRRRYVAAGIFTLAAALSKEEAVMLPALFATFIVVSERRIRPVLSTAPMWVAVAVYLVMRSQSAAFWLADAPAYYTLSFAPSFVARNVAEYADRAATVAAVTALAFAVASGLRPSGLTRREREVLMFGGLWVIFMFALTVFVPVRSSLYALLPSIGSALMTGTISAAALRKNERRFVRTAMVLVAGVVLLLPVYQARNRRWVVPAEVSQRVVTLLARDLRQAPAGHVLLIDDPTERFNLATAFGGLLSDALELHLGHGWSGQVAASDADAASAAYVYRLRGRNLEREH